MKTPLTKTKLIAFQVVRAGFLGPRPCLYPTLRFDLRECMGSRYCAALLWGGRVSPPPPPLGSNLRHSFLKCTNTAMLPEKIGKKYHYNEVSRIQFCLRVRRHYFAVMLSQAWAGDWFRRYRLGPGHWVRFLAYASKFKCFSLMNRSNLLSLIIWFFVHWFNLLNLKVSGRWVLQVICFS